MRRTPALIVGGGPAGAAAAIRLANAGVPHLLVERSRETGDALCGGFLSWRTLGSLARLGLDADSLNLHRIDHVALFAGITTRRAALPRPALAVSRRRLDAVMLAAALDRGAAVERGVAVREIGEGHARTADGATLATDAIFLASGKHDVRGAPRTAPGRDPALGLRIRLAAHPGLARLIGSAVELHLFDRGYAGIALQEDGSANVCMALRRSRLRDAGTPEDLLAALARELPALGDRLAYATAPGAPIDAVANVPYGWHIRSGRPGLFRLGDQAGVIPSLAGEGMGIAIASGVAAADAYARNGAAGATAWQRAFARRVARPIAVAGLARAAVEGPFSAVAMRLAGRGAIGLLARLTRLPA